MWSAALLSISASISTPAPSEPEPPPQIITPKVPPGVHEPQAAVDARGRVFVVYATPSLVSISVSSDLGATFGEPVAVGRIGKMAVGMRRGPRVAATPSAVIVSAIGGVVGDGHDGDLVAWRSTTSGVSWLAPVRVSTYPGSAREGLHAMCAGPNGELACAWLDVRSGKTEIYAAASSDEGASFAPEELVYHSPEGSVCECCHPSVAVDAHGALYVMFRNQLDGARDMYITESKDHGKTFSKAHKLGTGTWKLAACPMDGGALAIAPAGHVMSIWRREQDVYSADIAGANVVAQRDAGRADQLGSPTPNDSSTAEHELARGEQPWIASGANGVYRAWLTHRGGDLMLLAPKNDSAVKLADDSDDPMIASSIDGKGPVIAVWESTTDGKSAIRVARLDH
jgi:BNR repeat-like domain